MMTVYFQSGFNTTKVVSCILHVVLKTIIVYARMCIWYTDLYNTHDLKKDIIQKCVSDMRKWEIEEEERIG